MKKQNEEFEDIELSENQEKIEALTDKEKQTIQFIYDWLIKNRNYKEYDIDAEFKVDKILPLMKFVEHQEIMFNENDITQTLRFPIEQKNAKGETVKKITALTYRIRYQAYELNNYTRGINIQKEMNSYMDAQVGMLTGIGRSVIGKLYDVDHSLTRLIQSLYFL